MTASYTYYIHMNYFPVRPGLPNKGYSSYNKPDFILDARLCVLNHQKIKRKNY